MTRKTLVLITGGVIAAAITGTALGAGAAEVDAGRSRPIVPATPAPAADPAVRPAARSTTGPEDNPARVGSDDRSVAGSPGRPTTGGPSAAAGAAGRDRAVEIALARTGGGSVVKVEAETEHGRAVWSVRIARSGGRDRVDVDATTGQVVRYERTGDR
ncbi:PepSY domain-containing protein [Micromonospora zhanjiangensis]|uniref:PepSY domain-containing protein n=1 Tax=Micromonospora zhanjiangensis TaxID=1522057 RepID=A0ABV8KPQ3_9ACTN